MPYCLLCIHIIVVVRIKKFLSCNPVLEPSRSRLVLEKRSTDGCRAPDFASKLQAEDRGAFVNPKNRSLNDSDTPMV